MSSITVEQIKEIVAAAPGCGLHWAKRAFEATGSVEAAVASIRAEMAKSPEAKELKEGILDAYVHLDRIAVVVELRCETDFLSRSPEFRRLARDIAVHIAATPGSLGDDILALPYVKDESTTPSALVASFSASVRECVHVAYYSRREIGGDRRSDRETNR